MLRIVFLFIFPKGGKGARRGEVQCRRKVIWLQTIREHLNSIEGASSHPCIEYWAMVEEIIRKNRKVMALWLAVHDISKAKFSWMSGCDEHHVWIDSIKRPVYPNKLMPQLNCDEVALTLTSPFGIIKIELLRHFVMWLLNIKWSVFFIFLDSY